MLYVQFMLTFITMTVTVVQYKPWCSCPGFLQLPDLSPKFYLLLLCGYYLLIQRHKIMNLSFAFFCPLRPIWEVKKACFSFIMSHLSVCMYQHGFHWMEFHEINGDLYLNVKKIQVCFKLDQNIKHLTWIFITLLIVTCSSTTQEVTHCCTSMATLLFLSFHYNRYSSTMVWLIHAWRTAKIKMHHNVTSCIHGLSCLQLMIFFL